METGQSNYKTTYTWDYRNRLTDVEDYDNNGVLTEHVHYVYDVFDHLIATEVDPTGGGTYTEIQHYVLDVSPEIPAAGVPGTATAPPVFVFDGSGNLIGRNLVALNAAGVDAVVAQGAVTSLTQSDTVDWDLTDNLGSLRIVLDNASNVIDEIVYNSFGQVTYESSPTVAHWAGFAGGHVDANTGLVNDYHRWYDPAAGRWLSDDPLGLSTDANLSRYVGNSPTAFRDQTGLFETPQEYLYMYGPDGQFLFRTRNPLYEWQMEQIARKQQAIKAETAVAISLQLRTVQKDKRTYEEAMIGAVIFNLDAFHQQQRGMSVHFSVIARNESEQAREIVERQAGEAAMAKWFGTRLQRIAGENAEEGAERAAEEGEEQHGDE